MASDTDIVYEAPVVVEVDPIEEFHPYYNGAIISIRSDSGVSVGSSVVLTASPRRWGVPVETLAIIYVVEDSDRNNVAIPGFKFRQMKDGTNNAGVGANQWDIRYASGDNSSALFPLRMGEPQDNKQA